MGHPDPHSFADDAQPSTEHVDLALEVDFSRRVLAGTAVLQLDRPAAGLLDLDTRGITIDEVTDAAGRPVAFALDTSDPIKGTRLRLELRGDVARIRYKTSPDASALQWLSPAQTAGGVQPYVFTQCQPIHARSLFPCQDTPRVRIRYRAKIEIPAEARAVMAARHTSRDTNGARAIETFEMAQPIPPYLFAFAVGDISSKDIGPRSRVYAEPAMLEPAAAEFADVERMISTAESLFGPYDWERFDVLVMPPSFPYGGMENPRLTFLTPTVIAGDRSLVNVVAHELAHSWTGNLVTNASMNDFWLNEGFTTYAERRILEALEGKEAVALHIALGREGLEAEVNRFGKASRLTALRTDLSGIDPDQVYSRIPYEKGFFFLLRIEQAIGRDAFDRFLKRYIEAFRFRSIQTGDFLELLRGNVAGIDLKVALHEWIDGPGVPADLPRVESRRLSRVMELGAAHRAGKEISPEKTKSWMVQEWQIFLSELPPKLPYEACARLDERFGLSRSGNAEIRAAWLTIAARSGYTPAFPAIRETLVKIGRMKYLRPIYSALMAGGDETRALAGAAFAQAKDAYHPVARAMVESILSARPS